MNSFSHANNLHLHRVITLTFAVIVTLLASRAISSESYRKGYVLARFKDATSLATAHSIIDNQKYCVDRTLSGTLSYFLVRITDSTVTESMACADLAAYEEIARVRRDDCLQMNLTPDDPDFDDQWNLYQESVPGSPWDIDAPEAWDHCTGGTNLYGRSWDNTVAVIDRTPDPATPELIPQLWHNLEEILDGVDNDGNGYIDELVAVNTVDQNGTVPVPGSDVNYHGNAVCGMVGAKANNGELIAGVNWNTSIMMVDHGDGNFMSHALAGLAYVTSKAQAWEDSKFEPERIGTNVVAVNISWSGYPYGSCADGWRILFENLADLGVVVVSAPANVDQSINYAGNWDVPHTCWDGNPPYPAYHLVVVNSNGEGWKVGNSPYGADVVALAAPAHNVRVLNINDPDNRLRTENGTSFAAPQVAGAVALMQAVPNPSFQEFYYLNPRAGAEAICDMIVSSAKTWNNPPGYSRSSGILDLDHAVSVMNSYYHDNNHDFTAADALGTFPGANDHYLRAVNGRRYITFQDRHNVIYAYKRDDGTWRYYLLSRPMGSSPETVYGTGRSPSLAMYQPLPFGDPVETYIGWIATDPGSQGYDSLKLLCHESADNPAVVYDRWKLARFENPIWPLTGGYMLAPVVLAGAPIEESYNLPIVMTGVFGSDSPGLHFWQAPCNDWHDFDLWSHYVVPGSDESWITSVSAYRPDHSLTLYVAWSTADNEIRFKRGRWWQGEYWWDTGTVLSDGLTGIAEMGNVSICYSPFLNRVYAGWEGTDPVSGLREIYLAEGAVGQTVVWGSAYRMPESRICMQRCSPHLSPVLSNGDPIMESISPVGIAYERKWADEPESIIEARGLRPSEQNPSEWVWGPARDRPFPGRGPTLTEDRTYDPPAYGLAYNREDTYAIFSTPLVLFYPIESPPTFPPLDSDTISSTIILHPPLNLDRSIVIRDSGCLTLEVGQVSCVDDPVISFLRDDVEIIVEAGGILNIEGNVNQNIVFHSGDTNSTWKGIKINGGQLTMRYAQMYDCDEYCVFTNSPAGDPNPVVIQDCYFDGAKLTFGGNALRLWGSSGKTQSVTNCIIDNVPNGSGLYLSGCYVDFDGTTIQGCDVRNSYIVNTTGTFRNCTFKDRTSNYGIAFTGASTTANFQCCSFENIAAGPATVYNAALNALAGSAPTFGYEGSTGGVSNVIKDSSASLLNMWGNGILPIIDNVQTGGGFGGHNDWYQNMQSGKMICWGSPYPSPLKAYSAEKQYWNLAGTTTPKTSFFYPATSGYFDFDPYQTSNWGLCGGSGASVRDDGRDGGRDMSGLDDGETDYDSLFALGLTHETDEEFAEAQPIFADVAGGTDDYQLRWQAMAHIVSTQRHLDPTAGEAWIPSLIASTIAADSFVYSSFVYGNRLLASYRTDRAAFETAMDICVTLLGSGLMYNDSLLVAIDLLDIQMLAGLIGPGGNLDSDHGVPAGLRVRSITQGIELEQQLLNSLGVEDHPTYQPPVLPTRYQLYQNYPNPFNPTTEIRFDLPENTKVELRVFNTLGQLVTTLVNEDRQAGAYRVLWDGKSSSGREAAAGLYIYQLKAGSFTSAKKMALIK